MGLEENKVIARRFIQIWGAGDLGIIDELASPEFSAYYSSFPQAIKGGEVYKEPLKMFRSAFPDSNIDIEEEIAEGDKVVISWTCSGTHRGTLQGGNLKGIPPTGKKVKWTGITIYKITDGKVIEEKGEEDTLGLMRQIGVIPPMEQSK
jgi:steroid delta-isomerase-like uncharacterized protein